MCRRDGWGKGDFFCVRGYHVYLYIWAAAIREVLVCSTDPTKAGKLFIVKFIHVKYFHTFSVTKIFLQ